MKKEKRPDKGLLIIAHGSPLASANREFAALVRRVEKKLKGVFVQHAYLDCATPDILQGLEILVAKKCSHITVIPHFLSRGKHATRDIKNLVKVVAPKNPKIIFRITKPIGVLPEMAGLIVGIYTETIVGANGIRPYNQSSPKRPSRPVSRDRRYIQLKKRDPKRK